MRTALRRKIWGELADSHVRKLRSPDGLCIEEIQRLPFERYGLDGWNAICLLEDGEVYQVWERRAELEFESWYALTENGVVYQITPFESISILGQTAYLSLHRNPEQTVPDT